MTRMSAALEAALRKLGLVDRSDPATMAVAKLIIELGAMTALILKSASASRPSGEWNDDDYDVLADGVVVGRIFKANASPVGASWMWTLDFWHHEDRTPTHGYEVTREDAMAAFAKSWRKCQPLD